MRIICNKIISISQFKICAICLAGLNCRAGYVTVINKEGHNYDGKVNNRKIDYYNKLVHDLCSKPYIDNTYIGKSLLNRYNLHLNRDSDKALGRAFCTYLKTNRIQNSNNHFFRPPPGRQKEWTMYISHVKRMMKHKLE